MKQRTSDKSAKVTGAFKSKSHDCSSLQAAMVAFDKSPMAVWNNVALEPHKMPSRDMVRYLLSALAPHQTYEPPVLSKDLEQLNRVVRSIVEAVNEQVLTTKEADAVIHFIALCFAGRRFDEVLKKITTPKHGGWFVLQNQAWEE